MEGFKNTNENLKKESFGKFEGDEDFVFLSEEELASLDEDERSLYYRQLEKKGELEQKEYHNKAPEINQENMDKKWEKKLDKLHKNDHKEPYWRR